MSKSKPAFERLMQPGRIGNMTLRNRIIMPPMGTEFATAEGYFTQRMKDYYAARAKGGVAMVIVEIACIDSPAGKGLLGQVGIDDDRYLPGLSGLAQAIKAHGARAAIQLHHAGRSAIRAAGVQSVAPSAIAPPGYETPRELSPDDINRLIDCYALAAERARKAGFDGVEIHGAHLYLIAQFLSSAWNRRRDLFGGSLENRARFLLEIVRQCRKKVGQAYPLWVRMNGVEVGVDNGITLEESQQVAHWAEQAGADAVHVSAWGEGPGLYKYAIVPMTEPEGLLIPLAAGIKKSVGIPVIAVGRITPALAEETLKQGSADFISMGRALIVDPELPRKIASGDMGDIRPCLSCNYCTDLRNIEYGIRCQVNGALGREGEYQSAPAPAGKNVLVIGGGPGGMEAARVARLRGHRVTLFERQARLGGQLVAASTPPHKETIARFNDYLARQVAKLGVDVHLSEEATPELVRGFGPDAVVIATGVIPLVPLIPGLGGERTVLAEEVLLGRETGAKVVVIGGEVIGCEVAEYLATRGKSVTVCDVAEYVNDAGQTVKRSLFAEKLPASLRLRLMDRLSKLGVRMLGGVQYQELRDTGLLVNTAEGRTEVLEADTVVVAAGARPDNQLREQLKDIVAEVHMVGDCVQPGRIGDAVRDGYRVGQAI